MPSKPDSEKVAMALHLRRTQPDLSLKQIAERIGVASPTTVSNYIAMAEHHETWIPAVNRAAVGARLDLVLSTLMDRLLVRLDDPEAELEKTATAIVAVSKEIAKRHGLYAPVKTESYQADAAPAPDPQMTAEIQAALADLDAADRRTGADDAGN
jgi:transcriptional regulator with XRE-family HTH domain